MYRYYSIMRPVGPGTFPNTRRVKDVVNFDRRQFIPEINREVWGYIEYADPVTKKQVSDYELVPSNVNIIERLRASGWHNDFMYFMGLLPSPCPAPFSGTVTEVARS